VVTVSWELHCNGTGDVSISAHATGTDEHKGTAVPVTGDTVTVHQETAAALEAEITSPVGTETYSTCQNFDLTFTIHNSGEAEALDVSATVAPGATAEVEGQGQGVSWTTPILGDIPGGGTIGSFTYDMHCTASGNSTITVTPAGTDENTGEPIPGANITPDSITVEQETAAALEAEITSPVGTETYSTCQYFNLTFTIHNSGEANALNVTATIDPGATAEIEGQGQGVSWTTLILGDIPGGGTMGPFTYDMHCTASGNNTITVTPAGTDENTGEPIPGAKITPDSVTVEQVSAGLSAAVIAGIAVGSCAAAAGIFFAIRKWVWKRRVAG